MNVAPCLPDLYNILTIKGHALLPVQSNVNILVGGLENNLNLATIRQYERSIGQRVRTNWVHNNRVKRGINNRASGFQRISGGARRS